MESSEEFGRGFGGFWWVLLIAISFLPSFAVHAVHADRPSIPSFAAYAAPSFAVSAASPFAAYAAPPFASYSALPFAA